MSTSFSASLMPAARLATAWLLGVAGVGKVVAAAEWFPNAPDAASAALFQSFRQRFVKPQDDYVHMRMQLLVEAPAQSMEKAGSTDTLAVARQLHHAALLIPHH